MFDQFDTISTFAGVLSLEGQIRTLRPFPISTIDPWVANLAVFGGFKTPIEIEIDRLFFIVGTGSIHLDLGIYDAKGNLLVSTGSVSQTAGGGDRQHVSVTDTVLPAGFYYFALAGDANTYGPRGVVYYQTSPALDLPSDKMQDAWSLYEMANAFPLPSKATFGPYQRTWFPAMGLVRKGYF